MGQLKFAQDIANNMNTKDLKKADAKEIKEMGKMSLMSRPDKEDSGNGRFCNGLMGFCYRCSQRWY